MSAPPFITGQELNEKKNIHRNCLRSNLLSSGEYDSAWSLEKVSKLSCGLRIRKEEGRPRRTRRGDDGHFMSVDGVTVIC